MNKKICSAQFEQSLTEDIRPNVQEPQLSINLKELNRINETNNNINFLEIYENIFKSNNQTFEQQNPLLNNTNLFSDILDMKNVFSFAFDNNGLFSLPLNDDENENKNHNKSKGHKKKRSLDLYKNNMNLHNLTISSSIFAKKDHEEYLKKLHSCSSNKLTLEQFQLKDFGSFFKPNAQFVWFDYSQYENSDLVFSGSKDSYIGLLIRLQFFNIWNFYNVNKTFRHIELNKFHVYDFICNVQQFYIYNDFFLIVFKDGETFWFGKMKREAENLEFQTSFYKEYDSRYIRCRSMNLYESDKRQTLCCKKFAFGTLLDKYLKKVFIREKLERQLEDCFNHNIPIILSKGLQFEFEPKPYEEEKV
ncbi:hypothetical protein GVAV_002678 [Gurleya vavrai]